MKLVNQILVVHNMLGVGEALLLAAAEGLDLERTLDAVSGGAAGSWMLSNRGTQVIERDWSPGFTIDLQQKDLRLVLEAFDRLRVPAVGTGLIRQLYTTLQRRGLGAEGNHALVKALETWPTSRSVADPPRRRRLRYQLPNSIAGIDSTPSAHIVDRRQARGGRHGDRPVARRVHDAVGR